MRIIIRWSSPKWPWRSIQAVWLRRLYCALLGHDAMVVIGERRMALHCYRCQWRSPGWQLDGRVRPPIRARREMDLPRSPAIPLRWPAR